MGPQVAGSGRLSSAGIHLRMYGSARGWAAFTPRTDEHASLCSSARPRPQDALPRWENGPPFDDPAYFPIGVWLQSATNARAYQDLGVNLYIGQWKGPTENQLQELGEAGMPVMASQNEVALRHLDDPTIVGWTQQDEPDNAQWNGAGYDPCVEPDAVMRRYQAMKTADPTRPVWLNLGQGVAWDFDRPYVGRGSACARRWDHYPEYVKAADIVSFDIYPITSPYDHIRGDLSRVAVGVERLVEWTGGAKPVWNVIETTHIKSDQMPEPRHVRAEVWMSIIHGSRGIVYFAHEWQPSFREAGLLHYPEMREAVAAVNREVRELAPVLHTPVRERLVGVRSVTPDVPIDVAAFAYGGSTFVFAVSMRDEPTEAEFTTRDVGIGRRVEVIGERRELPMDGGEFRDSFAGYEVHLYRFDSLFDAALPWLGR
jgi:hypothetical protein